MQPSTQGTEPDRKVPVTHHALFQRLKRRLSKGGETLHITRQAHVECCGAYHTVSESDGSLGQRIDDLEALARELGVLRAYERVEVVS